PQRLLRADVAGVDVAAGQGRDAALPRRQQVRHGGRRVRAPVVGPDAGRAVRAAALGRRQRLLAGGGPGAGRLVDLVLLRRGPQRGRQRVLLHDLRAALALRRRGAAGPDGGAAEADRRVDRGVRLVAVQQADVAGRGEVGGGPAAALDGRAALALRLRGAEQRDGVAADADGRVDRGVDLVAVAGTDVPGAREVRAVAVPVAV